ncbi:RELT-like protein 1 [Esox lucius]|uniref:RELT like 1 n=1 Tax=Esox lucius TaxID=8010 RepID=A0A3P8ZVT8_ESOLU|nr:RELT-like protein 1 [Esox lucius]
MADSSVTLPPRTLGGGGGGHGGGDMRNPEYIAFVLVPVFFLLGLLGVLICHVLKKKGYRCTTEAEDEEEAARVAEEKDLEMAEMNNAYIEGNNDTVGQIVHYIMKNEANTDALKAMVFNTSVDSDGPPLTPTSPMTPTSPGTPLSPGAPAGAAKHTCNHLHTVGGVGANRVICNRCNHKKWPLMRRSSGRKAADRRSHVEVTVLAVGRFRVTKCDKERPLKERRTLLVTDSNGSLPRSPTETEHPKSRTASESQQEQKSNAK